MRESADGKKGVSDDFQTLDRGLDKGSGAAGNQPGDFHLRKRGDFRDAAERERERFSVRGEGAAAIGVPSEIEEDFVRDQRELVLAAKRVQPGKLLRLNEGAGRVVRMDEKDGAGARRDGGFDGAEIEEPSVGVGQRVGNQANVVETG